MANGNYTKEDRAAFEAKDRLNAYMSALKAASTNHQGLGKESSVILEEANEYYVALLEAKDGKVKGCCDKDCDCDTVAPSEPLCPDYPMPNPQELDILMKISKSFSENCPENHKVDFDLVCKRVMDVFKKYPKSEKSITKVVDSINLMTVCVREN